MSRSGDKEAEEVLLTEVSVLQAGSVWSGGGSEETREDGTTTRFIYSPPTRLTAADFRATRENQPANFCSFLFGASTAKSERAWATVAHECMRFYFRLPPPSLSFCGPHNETSRSNFVIHLSSIYTLFEMNLSSDYRNDHEDNIPTNLPANP